MGNAPGHVMALQEPAALGIGTFGSAWWHSHHGPWEWLQAGCCGSTAGTSGASAEQGNGQPLLLTNTPLSSRLLGCFAGCWQPLGLCVGMNQADRMFHPVKLTQGVKCQRWMLTGLGLQRCWSNNLEGCEQTKASFFSYIWAPNSHLYWQALGL